MRNDNLTFDERMEVEAAGRRERYAALLELARGVAELMGGGGWSASESEPNGDTEWTNSFRNSVRLCDAYGRRLDLTIDMHDRPRQKDRDALTIDGRYEFGDSSLGIGFPHGRTAPRIQVNRTRGAAVVAREIKRRFLGEYDVLRAEIAARVQTATDYRDKQAGILARLVALAKPEPRMMEQQGFRLRSEAVQGLYVGVKVGNGEVDVKIENLTESQAGEVLRLLAPWFATRKGV